MSEIVLVLNYSKIEIEIELLDDDAPLGYWGSRLRGGYGKVLKEGLCDHLDIEDCRQCPRFNTCDYPRLFEPRATPEMSRKFDAPLRNTVDLPRAFVIDPPPAATSAANRGDRLAFGFVSLGPLCHQIAYPVKAFERFGEIGFISSGARPVRFRLVGVRDLLNAGQSAYADGALTGVETRDISGMAAARAGVVPSAIRVEFITPVHIDMQNPRLQDAASGLALFSDFHDLIYHLANRIAGLWQLYGEGWLGQAGFYRWRDGLLKASRQVATTHHDLTVVRWKRYSNRLDGELPMSGFAGSLGFEGDFTPFLDLLSMGELVHVGQQSAFGLGRYKLDF